jgi:hypothetical protein
MKRVKSTVEGLFNEHKTKERVVHVVNECIWGLVSYSENNKVILTAAANPYQIRFWTNVLIYINKNH